MFLRLLSILFALILSCPALAQSVQEIKSNRDYLYGEGMGATEQKANQAALANLIEKIAVTVKSDFTSMEREQAVGSKISSETEFQRVIRSYSSATLTNAHSIIIKHEPDAHVLRYIHVKEIDRMFKGRADKAVEFVRLADAALRNTQIDDALRYYYWALCLVRSLRYPNELKTTVDGQEFLLVAWLPRRIEEVCSNVSVQLAGSLGNDAYRLNVNYDGKPVRSLDYSVNDGYGYGAIFSARDGEGTMEISAHSIAERVTLKIETEFSGLAVTDSEVESVLGIESIPFKHAYIPIAIPKKLPSAEKKAQQKHSALASDNKRTVSSYGQTMKTVAQALSESKPEKVERLMTPAAYQELTQILSYGKYSVARNQQVEVFENPDGGIVCRGLQCLFRFGNSRTFNEQLSFSFEDGKISHVALGLGKQLAEEEILSKDAWAEQSRHHIVAFLENYRTAYALKDAEYLERVFDDNAVIIVGKTLTKAPQLNDLNMQKNQYVELTRYTKEQFIRNLRKSFASKQYVNLHFSDCTIAKLGKAERYGIQIRQDYYSDNYGDSGYLYLLVDLTNPKQPIIHVRSWQTAPDPNFGIIGPGHF